MTSTAAAYRKGRGLGRWRRAIAHGVIHAVVAAWVLASGLIPLPAPGPVAAHEIGSGFGHQHVGSPEHDGLRLTCCIDCVTCAGPVLPAGGLPAMAAPERKVIGSSPCIRAQVEEGERPPTAIWCRAPPA